MSYSEENRSVAVYVLIALVVLGVITSLIGLGMWGFPKYRIYKQDLRGQATLREQEWEKKVLIEQAKAEKESASLYAEAEVERAKGVAQANQIIGDSLKGNDEYLRYLWIQTLTDDSNDTIYIPTEANLPILEARPKTQE
jgi:hypothetical protein